MPSPFDEDFELLRDYLSARLDPQLGKAATRFAEFSAGESDPALAKRSAPRRGRLIAAVVATAASVAGAVWCGVQLGKLPGPRGGETAAQPGAPVESPKEGPLQREQQPDVASGKPVPPKGGTTNNSLPIDAELVLVGRQLQWQTVDEGIVYLDPHTPVRKLRRQRLERVEWYDVARGARVQMLVPREEIQFVALPSS